MNEIKKAVLLGLLFLVMFGSINFVYAQTLTIKQYGQLVNVEKTSPQPGPDADNRYEYEVTMIIRGVEVYLTMWMKENEYTELIGVKAQMITIYYTKKTGKRTYQGFKYGDHTGPGGSDYIVIDHVLFKQSVTGELEEVGPCY